MLMAWPEGAAKGAAEVGKILSRWVSCFRITGEADAPIR